MPRSTLRHLARAVGVTGLYFLSGRVGLGLAFLNESATAVWPPAGIALAALLVYGYGMWPAIFVGAFLVNNATAGDPIASLGIAAGNTLEGLLGAWFVRRFAGGTEVFGQPQRIFAFAVLGGMVATSVAATIGVTSLMLRGHVLSGQFGPIWLTWWLGDASGVLVVAPFLILWAIRPRISWSLSRVAEAIALFACLILSGVLAFGGVPPGFRETAPLEFLCVPILVWAAFRFGPREAATATLLLSGMAILGTLQGAGPFARVSTDQALLLLQTYMAVISVLVLGVTAALAERRKSEARIRTLAEELEGRVERRTQELRRVVESLREEASRRERAQAALARSESRLREAQRVARLGSWEWDIQTNALWWSDEMIEIYGIDRASFPGSFESFLERVHPEDRPYVRRVVEAAYGNRQPFSFEHRIVRPDGSVVSLLGHGRVEVDESGRPVRMVGTGQDITEEKLAQEERSHLLLEKEARRQAEESNRLKDEFLATLSHELRTPLNAIVGWANLLREGNLDPATTKRAVETISRNAQIQSRLISDILDISRMIAGQLDFKLQMVHLRSVIEGALDTMRPAAQASGIRLDAKLAPDGHPVLGSPDRLQQVIWNLLSNAIKFTPEGGSVAISLVSEEGFATIQVEDDGIGIDPDFLPHVFERFRQRNPSTSRKHGGLGLGLAIARHIVEYHGGTITAENREMKGARFTVRLPLAESAPLAAGPPTPAAAPAATPAEESSADTEHPLGGVLALLVEDEPDSRELLATLLIGCGADVRLAGSAPEALELLRRDHPDLLISDIAMPGETGYDLIERIRALPPEEGGRVPAIALTAYTSPEDARRALRAGYHAHLSKPLQLRELVRVVVELMDSSTGRSSKTSRLPERRKSDRRPHFTPDRRAPHGP
ncbi:MAG TPA: MASE1 domain-containing protein [Candidatus Eisenbacteria bacterium]|nr:MASE1 domain-containing protein [Candidatus Eisenbacteria bacterium]